MKHITVVIKYEDDQEQPAFHANMEVLGGVLEGVIFDDAMQVIEDLEDELLEWIDLGDRLY